MSRVPCRACSSAGIDWRGDECETCKGSGSVELLSAEARVELDAEIRETLQELPLDCTFELDPETL